eukprot:9495735-Pyramimonas_sp.AAC.1
MPLGQPRLAGSKTCCRGLHAGPALLEPRWLRKVGRRGCGRATDARVIWGPLRSVSPPSTTRQQ